MQRNDLETTVVDRRLACAGGVLCTSPCWADRCAAQPAPGCSLGQRQHLILRRSVLSRRRPRRGGRHGEPALWPGPGREVLYPHIGSIWTFSYKGDCRNRQRGTACPRRIAVSREQPCH